MTKIFAALGSWLLLSISSHLYAQSSPDMPIEQWLRLPVGQQVATGESIVRQLYSINAVERSGSVEEMGMAMAICAEDAATSDPRRPAGATVGYYMMKCTGRVFQ